MQKIYQHIAGSLIVSVFIISVLSCATTHSTYSTTNKKEAPGLYSLSGWGGQSSYWNGTTNIASDLDINGEVGHPLSVSYPTARCTPSHSWTYNKRILAGTLPPGMSWDQRSGYYGYITGVPTERGHWIIRLEMYDISCEGRYYTLQQELRFHITGSGRVHD